MGRLAHRCLAGGCGCRSRRLLRSNCSIGVAIQAWRGKSKMRRGAHEQAEERDRAAEARERQGQGIALLRSAALLSARLHCLSGPASWLLFWGGVPYWCVIAIKTHLVYQSLIT